jgi:hypothetical protein
LAGTDEDESVFRFCRGIERSTEWGRGRSRRKKSGEIRRLKIVMIFICA